MSCSTAVCRTARLHQAAAVSECFSVTLVMRQYPQSAQLMAFKILCVSRTNPCSSRHAIYACWCVTYIAEINMVLAPHALEPQNPAAPDLEMVLHADCAANLECVRNHNSAGVLGIGGSHLEAHALVQVP